jgi:CHAD domain-containing protein
MSVPKPSTRQPPPLRGAMSCDVAFRTAATHYLGELTAQHQKTSAGRADALHAMRVSLTRLRTSILFFSPMVAGIEQMRLTAELKWLNAHLGMVRDLDVALDRLTKINRGQAQPSDRSWKRERAACQRLLTRALRSRRYQRLIRDLTAWIDRGDWARKISKEAADRRAAPVADYCARTLTLWRKELLKKSRKLTELGVKKRHRLRLKNKRLSYAIEAAANLVPDSETSTQEATIKLLRVVQRSLGQLNDDTRRRSLVTTLGEEDKMAAPNLLLGPKQKKLLLRKAEKAYEELVDLKPLKISGD